MAWKLSIKGNFFYAEEQGGTNLCHEYPQIQCRFGKKFNDSTKYTFYQNHTGLVIDRLENLEWTEFLDSTGTPFASQLAFETWCNENLSKIGAGAGGTTTSELDLLKSELIPIISSNTQYYLQEKTVVDNTTGAETVTQVFYDSNLSVVATPSSYEIGTLKKDLTYYQVYYSIGGVIKQGFTALDNSIQRIYDSGFNELLGAIIVEKEDAPFTVEYTGNDNDHFQLNAGKILIVNDVKCIGGHIKGKCDITINNKKITYDAGDPFPNFNSEKVLKNTIIIQQITNHSLIFTLK